jgi:AcrR family transcriptional regulator
LVYIKMMSGGDMKHEQRRRGVGRPPKTGPGAEDNPFGSMTQEERRTLFLETAARLFEAKGYSNTSVQDITDELGFAKSVFYYYWDNKMEILQEIHDRALAEVNKQLDKVEARYGSPKERMEAAIRAHLRSVLRNRSLTAAHLSDLDLSEETRMNQRAYTMRVTLSPHGTVPAAPLAPKRSKIFTRALFSTVALRHFSTPKSPKAPSS